MKVDFDHLKRTTDLVRVVESYGIKLKKTGAIMLAGVASTRTKPHRSL